MFRVAGSTAVIGIALLVFAQQASASLLAYDYFNYGTSTTTLGGQGTVSNGFSGAWVDTATNVTGRNSGFDGSSDETLTYVPATALTFSNAYYDNSFNTGGTIQQGTGSQLAYATTYRSFTTPISGTIWVSALVQFDNDSTTNTMLVWFDPSTNHWSGGNNTGVYSDNNNGTNAGAVVKYGGAYSSSADYYASSGTTYLLLTKLEVTTGSDSISFWMKTESDDLSSEASLGTPLYTLSASDVLGSALERIALSFATEPAQFDALRVGETLYDVTVVPEPSALALLFFALATVAVFLRR